MSELKLALREVIQGMGDTIAALPSELHADVPIRQHWGDGLYLREMRMRPGEVVVGRTHRRRCTSIIAGRAQVIGGDEPYEIEGVTVVHSEAGERRAIRAISDVTWVCVFAWDGGPRPDNEMIDALTY